MQNQLMEAYNNKSEIALFSQLRRNKKKLLKKRLYFILIVEILGMSGITFIFR